MTTTEYGPSLPISQEIHASKYRMDGETFFDAMNRQSSTLADNDEHRKAYSDIILNQRYMAAGRVQAAIGSPRRVTPWNCFVSGTINDSFTDIMDKAKEAGTTMRMGGGIGYDFSTLRPKGERIKSMGSQSSGPVSFMDIYDAICGTIASAGHRRGAQMGVMRVDHPDILEFIHAKRNSTRLTRFNVSVGITDAFMKAVKRGSKFALKWRGRVMEEVDARALWDDIMRSTWDWAEPGVLFIDRINGMNNLWYCENIAATNPCFTAETPLLTKQGYFPIGDLAGKIIEIWNGREWSDVLPFSTGINEVVKVELTDGTTLRCTPYHKFLIVDGFDNDSPQRIEAQDLTPGMKLQKWDMPVINNGETYSVDAYSQGFYAGDGNLGYNYSWVYGPKEPCIHRLVGVVDKYYEDRDAWTWRHGPMLDKRFVPVNGSLEYCLNWLAGLLDADGTVTRDKNGNGLQVVSIDFDFLNDVKLMLSRLGVRAKVAHAGDATARYMTNQRGDSGWYDCKETKRLLIGNQDTYHLTQLGIKFERLEVHSNPPQRDARQYIRVKSVEWLGEDEETFCVTEPLKNQMTVNGVVVGNCGEQPLPPYGACLLGSFNLVKYVKPDSKEFDYNKFKEDIPHVVRAMDNIIDVGHYPLPAQEEEGKNKRRMGLGLTGVANAIEAQGKPYGSEAFLEELEKICIVLRDECYRASVQLSKEKGPFPLFDDEKYLAGKFIQTLPEDIREGIKLHGIRNSHLTSIAPTGTISLSADNVSSGIEPVFTYGYERTIQTFDGPVYETVSDYAYREWGVEGRTANAIEVEDHVQVLSLVQKYVDSACSKTCNVGDNVSWERFKDVYMTAYDTGAKGCTTFRSAGKRYGILNEKPTEDQKPVKEYIDDEDSVEACFIDPQTGQPSCS